MNIVEVTEYDYVGSLLELIKLILTTLYLLLPIVILLFIARIVWLIYKIEKRNHDEKDNT